MCAAQRQCTANGEPQQSNSLCGLQKAAIGTFETRQLALGMSVDGGRPEVGSLRPTVDLTFATEGVSCKIEMPLKTDIGDVA
jgi:hypothetical protein